MSNDERKRTLNEQLGRNRVDLLLSVEAGLLIHRVHALLVHPHTRVEQIEVQAGSVASTKALQGVQFAVERGVYFQRLQQLLNGELPFDVEARHSHVDVLSGQIADRRVELGAFGVEQHLVQRVPLRRVDDDQTELFVLERQLDQLQVAVRQAAGIHKGRTRHIEYFADLAVLIVPAIAERVHRVERVQPGRVQVQRRVDVQSAGLLGQMLQTEEVQLVFGVLSNQAIRFVQGSVTFLVAKEVVSVYRSVVVRAEFALGLVAQLQVVGELKHGQQIELCIGRLVDGRGKIFQETSGELMQIAPMTGQI